MSRIFPRPKRSAVAIAHEICEEYGIPHETMHHYPKRNKGAPEVLFVTLFPLPAGYHLAKDPARKELESYLRNVFYLCEKNPDLNTPLKAYVPLDFYSREHVERCLNQHVYLRESKNEKDE